MNRRYFKLVAIVEGDGEVYSLPALLVRFWKAHKIHNYQEPLVLSSRGVDKLKAPYNPERRNGIEHFIRQALFRGPDLLLILLDSDTSHIKSTPTERLSLPAATPPSGAVGGGLPRR